MTKRENLDRAFRVVTEGEEFCKMLADKCNEQHPELKLTTADVQRWRKAQNDKLFGTEEKAKE